jgi:hypothetical protein
VDTLFLSIIHDEDAVVYLNGVKAAELTGHTGSYIMAPISEQAKKALKKGTNVLAIHCRQTQGGQSIDAGLVELTN